MASNDNDVGGGVDVVGQMYLLSKINLGLGVLEISFFD